MKKIMIVDDEPNIVLSLDFLMKREGYSTSVSRDGNEAIRYLQANRPDLVLLDVGMPGSTGFDVCRFIKEQPTLQGVKVILLTARGREQDIAQGRSIGADDYITKPFSTRDLAERVKVLLRGTDET